MANYGKYEVALTAELLADRLIQIYRDQQVPAMVEGFAAAGFTQANLRQDTTKLFQMVVIAAYDRRPFTVSAGGFEAIWGTTRGAESVPQALTGLHLFTPQEVLSLDKTEIERLLTFTTYHGRSLASDGENTYYARTLTDCAHVINDDFRAFLVRATDEKDAQAVYGRLRSIHGIGATIGSKLVKYWLREIGVGRASLQPFPLAVVWPMTEEYHVDLAAGMLAARLDRSLVPLTMGVLLARGEPYAIDALFYIHRHRQWELEEFVEDAKNALARSAPALIAGPASSIRESDYALAQRLLPIIKEIYDDNRAITREGIRRAGLQGTITPQQIEASARGLYTQMGQLAEQGKVVEMLAYYEACLSNENAKFVGYGIGLLGRKSMESQLAVSEQSTAWMPLRLLGVYSARS